MLKCKFVNDFIHANCLNEIYCVPLDVQNSHLFFFNLLFFSKFCLGHFVWRWVWSLFLVAKRNSKTKFAKVRLVAGCLLERKMLLNLCHFFSISRIFAIFTLNDSSSKFVFIDEVHNKVLVPEDMVFKVTDFAHCHFWQRTLVAKKKQPSVHGKCKNKRSKNIRCF